VGIFDAFSQSTAITHNVVREMPYTGISSGFRWNESGTSQRGGLIAYNHVYDTMNMLADGGCLYTLGYQPGAVILGNVFHTVHRSAYAHGGAPNNGIFFDQGSKGFRVEGNTIYDTSGEPIRFNQCGEDSMTWKDNQFGVGR
jgi:beta-glucuronidase